MPAAEAELRASFIAGLAGDAARYRQFLDGLSGHLRAYLRRRLPRALADVEDILQETLLAVHNARHTYRTEQPLTAWVHAIARYKLMDFFGPIRDAKPCTSPSMTTAACSSPRMSNLPTRSATSGSCSRPCPTATACPSCW